MCTSTAMSDHKSELGFWRVEGQPIVVEHSPSVLETLRNEAVEGLHRIPRGGLEIGGVLFGKRSGNTIRVLASRPLACEHACGPSFVLSEKDEAALRQLAGSAGTDPELAGMISVGWYHSHTRSGISLTDGDVGLWDRHFPEPWQIALVLHPQKLKPTRAGYFFRETHGHLRTDSSYREFELEPAPVQRQTQSHTPAMPGREREEQTAAPDIRPDREPVPLRVTGRFPWLLFALAWCLAAASLAYALRDYWLPKDPAPASMQPLAPDPVREQMAVEIQKLRSELVHQIQRNQELEAEISAVKTKSGKGRESR
jgi:proteasome lid subunit RPN8/RPN11